MLDPGRGKTKSGYPWALARDKRGWVVSQARLEIKPVGQHWRRRLVQPAAEKMSLAKALRSC